MPIDAIEKAIELNGVAVPFNLRAFELGRVWAYAPERLHPLLREDKSSTGFTALTILADVVADRVELLSAYQDSAYAGRYRTLVEQVRSSDTPDDDLALAVARYFAKLMAYKDEYEVARLHSDPVFMEKLKAQFEGDFKLAFNLAPPLLSRRDPVNGQLRKREFGGWMMGAFRLLARFKGLRGTALDIFGYSTERRMERQLIVDYESMITELPPQLSAENYRTAVQLAELPEHIRDYGHVKERHVEAVKVSRDELLEQFSNPTAALAVEVKLVG